MREISVHGDNHQGVKIDFAHLSYRIPVYVIEDTYRTHTHVIVGADTPVLPKL